jgi:16S rRNA (guanine527-N7)-methyltransferase
VQAALETPLADALHAGAARMGVTLSSDQSGQLLRYLALLSKWSAVYNLTSLREAQQILSHHILDSLSIVPLVKRLAPASILDVGTGAGLPGIVLAVAFPGIPITLVDAVQKKTAFLIQAKAELGLDFTVQHARVEALTGDEQYSCIVSRAFASLGDLVRLCAARLAPDGVFLAMKGAPSAAELASLSPPWRILESVPLEVPQVQAARSAIIVGRPDSSAL